MSSFTPNVTSDSKDGARHDCPQLPSLVFVYCVLYFSGKQKSNCGAKRNKHVCDFMFLNRGHSVAFMVRSYVTLNVIFSKT